MTTAAQRRYADYLDSPRWRLVRSVRKAIDGHHCRVCFSRERLQVHHASYRNRGRAGLGIVGEIRDTLTLCDNCHRNAHR